MHAQAVAIAAQLVDQGEQLRAYTDPDKVAGNLPAVLVPPPTFNWQTRSATWRLVVFSSHEHPNEACFVELDDMVRKVAAVLDVETAAPAAYLLQRDKPARPAFVITYTTSH